MTTSIPVIGWVSSLYVFCELTAVTYSDPMGTTVAKVIGANARKLRLDAGVTLDQFALAARSYGLPWSTGRVGDFESGRVLPNLETLYAVAAALGQAIGQPVTLAELLASTGPVAINDKLSVGPAALADAVSGQPVAGETGALGVTMGKGFDTKQIAAGISRQALVRAVLAGFSEADARMCRNIGVTPERGAAAMAKLWRRTFSAERDHRAEPDANAQRRGQISRQLKAELQKAVSK
jgi:transcriptional regulator with XRE-family HTH domain